MMAFLKRGRKIGEGTSGAIYQAEVPGDHRPLVVKRNFAESHASFIQCIREVDILTQLKGHPHIVELVYCAPTQSFSTPLSPRGSLDINGNGRPSSDDSLHTVFPESAFDLHTLSVQRHIPAYDVHKRYMAQSLLGLHRMHQLGVAHFDIKPNNIVVSPMEKDLAGDFGVAKLCDFGLARPFSYQESLMGITCTHIFRPPEIMMEQPGFDFKADVWSMGVTFFQMVTKRQMITGNFSTFHPKLSENDALLTEYIKVVPGGLPIKHQRAIKNRRIRNSPIDPEMAAGSSIPSAPILNIPLTPPLAWPTIQQCPRDYEALLDLSDGAKVHFEACAGPLSVFCDLLSKMLEFDPHNRFSALDCLNHPFFNSSRTLITNTLTKYPDVQPLGRKLYSHHCVERQWGSMWLSQIYNAKGYSTAAPLILRWYTDRTIFQAWDIYERYLYAMASELGPTGFALESHLKGFIHTKTDAYQAFLVCLYTSIKYFNVLPPSWEELVDALQGVTDMVLEGNHVFMAEVMEWGLIVNCFNYRIYAPTLFEAADWYKRTHTGEDIIKLMLLVSRCPNLDGHTLKEIYEHYLKNIAGISYQTPHFPIVW
jgi:serine/threonine protein kinase